MPAKSVRYANGPRFVASLCASFLVLSQCYAFVPAAQAAGAPGSTPLPSAPTAPVRPGSAGLTVASGKSLVLNITSSSILNLGTFLKNQGTVYVVTTNPQLHTASVGALNIFNAPGAIITTVLPSGGLSGYSTASTNLGLTLIAAKTFINRGTISSASNLTLLAGSSLVNAPAPGYGSTGSSGQPLLQAANTLTVLAPSITNAGVISAVNGDVHIASPAAYTATLAALQQTLGSSLPASLGPSIVINNTGGSISAANGTINFGGADLPKNGTLSIFGGSIIAPTINIDGGNGSVYTKGVSVQGLLNVSACSAQIGTDSGLLDLGNLNLKADPTFYNDAGDILISGSVSFGGDLAIIASGSITANNPQNISTNLNNVGHDVYLIAGAKVVPSGSILPLPTRDIPANQHQLTGDQLVSVRGASNTGGNISLAGSTITANSTTGINGGGDIVLIAFAGPNKGSISNVNLVTGASGRAANGGILIIAGATQGVAVSGVGITVNGSPNSFASSTQIYAAPVQGAAIFNASGSGFASFTPSSTLNRADVLVSAPMQTSGGSVLINTSGAVTTSANIQTDGGAAGRSAGDVTISADTITVGAPITARGASGGPGAAGIPGMPTPAGQDGGSGGKVSLTAFNDIDIKASIAADAGSGGRGGDGAPGNPAGMGGFGGMGGGAGTAGQVKLSTTFGDITQQAGTISAMGGRGGDGGTGARGGDGKVGGAGGLGGNAGTSSGGGLLLVRNAFGSIAFNGAIDLSGGDGGNGGAGGNGGTDVNNISTGGAGGSSGMASGGSLAGKVDVETGFGDITVAAVKLTGGLGGTTANGGIGGTGLVGGNGGDVESAGMGGGGGKLFLTSDFGAVTLSDNVQIYGGAGGALSGSTAGNALGGKAFGGLGGSVDDGGAGGDGGMVSLSANKAIAINGNIDAYGGIGGAVSATAGAGGSALTGGLGGSLGNGGGGGLGGKVSAESLGASVASSGIITAVGGDGGAVSGNSGKGGSVAGVGTEGGAGNGGRVGSSGSGGLGGSVKYKAETTINVSNTLAAGGGLGGVTIATAGDGGNGTSKSGAGAGGSISRTGSGGGGGSIELTGKQDITIVSAAPQVVINLDASGGSGGTYGSFPLVAAKAGNGGTGSPGGGGGSVGNSGSGGGGGMITVKTTQTGPTGLVKIDSAILSADGGSSLTYFATAGNGGDGLTGSLFSSAGNGGAGGSIGNQGRGASGGQVSVTSTSIKITINGFIHANGGGTPGPVVAIGFAGQAGKGGNGGTLNGIGFGGFGGSAGNAGSAGVGGFIKLDAPGAITIDGDGTLDTLGVRGGNVSNNLTKGGDGGKGGSVFGNGGNGGSVFNNGSAGDGGTIKILGAFGDITNDPTLLPTIVAAGGKVLAFSVASGAGGDAGGIGNGGSSGNVFNNGDGGNGGKILISSITGRISLSPLIVTGSDVDGMFNPTTGNGGNATIGNGGNSGSIGHNGAGGNGGEIREFSLFGALAPVGDPQTNSALMIATAGIVCCASARTGDGGSTVAGNGGSSGSIGRNGQAGDGGLISLFTGTGQITTTRGPLLVPGADGSNTLLGLYMSDTTGNGGSTQKGNGGSSGSIGANASGGKSGRIELTTLTGSINITGPLILRGGEAGGSANRTGNGGNSADGNGGNSGSIARGGDGGDGGTAEIYAGSSYNAQEAIVATGGNAAVNLYQPITGKGGNGLGMAGIFGTGIGGSSGSIGAAGNGGVGGSITIKSAGGTLVPDRILVDGGSAGEGPPPPPQYMLPQPSNPGDGVMRGQTGDGGDGTLKGGFAGTVGDGVFGGKAGTISLDSGGVIPNTTVFSSIGGTGGSQAGIGGHGGNGVGVDGVGNSGGSVGAAGNGAPGNYIKVVAVSSISIRDVFADGGKGGDNSGQGGVGGNGALLGGSGGSGGKVAKAGNGGDAGTLEVKISNIGDLTFYDDQHALPLTLNGGDGGVAAGQGGKGGNAQGGEGAGGAGGSLDTSGSAGKGGTMKITVLGGLVDFRDSAFLNGGKSGLYSGIGGDGGNGSGHKAGGSGGDIGIQGGGGVGGKVSIFDGTLLVESGYFVTVDGGIADEYAGHSGNGGAGGGAGGAAGACSGAGSAGGAGSIGIASLYGVTVDGGFSAEGADHEVITAVGGKGGDAGAFGGDGGKGGAVSDGGGAGRGGKISVLSLFDSVTGTGVITADGGNARFDPLAFAVGGDGGNGKLKGAGGAGGAAASGAGGNDGGKISIAATGPITLANLQANGGSALGQYLGQGGAGGIAGAVAGAGGDAGRVGNAGGGGAGGSIELLSIKGDITPGMLLAKGGDVGDYAGTGKNGGSQLTGFGAGGRGGALGRNGNGGFGGSIKITTLGNVTSTADWNVDGGSVGAYGGHAGKGGDVAGNGAAGGDGGGTDSNGIGGGLGKISVSTANGAIDLSGTLFARGGSVLGDYTAIGGDGGAGIPAGGAGGSTGNAGRAGDGGFVKLKSGAGTITVQSIDATAGLTAIQRGVGGKGGASSGVVLENHAGGGGSVDEGTAGGSGGDIEISSSFGKINVNAAILASGSDGGLNLGTGGDGGIGAMKGGSGGSVGGAGDGGAGGRVSVSNFFGAIAINAPITANGGIGGDQSGAAGIGNLGTGQQGGNGGKLLQAGDGGGRGEITVFSFFGPVSIGADLNANGSAGGAVKASALVGAPVNSGHAGKGGDSLVQAGNGGFTGVGGAGGSGGTILVGSGLGNFTSIGQINALGAKGGDQVGVGGDGGNGTGPRGAGGNGGNTLSPGSGGNGGSITVLALASPRSQLGITPVVNPPGLGGLQLGHPGAAGTPGGTAGIKGPAGRPGADGTLDIKMADNDDAAAIEDGDLKKKKNRLLVAWRRHAQASQDGGGTPGGIVYSAETQAMQAAAASEVQGSSGVYCQLSTVPSDEEHGGSADLPVAFVERVSSGTQSTMKPSTAMLTALQLSASPALVSETECTASVIERTATAGAELAMPSNAQAEQFQLNRGEILFAPASRSIVVVVPNGTVEIAAGAKATVEVSEDGAATTIRTVHNNKQSDVRFTRGALASDVNIGQQLIICRRGGEPAGRTGIATRSTVQSALPDGLMIQTSEFSLASAVTNDRVLRALYLSHIKNDRRHMDQICKDICIMTYTTLGHGVFQSK